MLLSSITDEQLLTLQKGEHVYKQVAISYTMGYFILNPFNLSSLVHDFGTTLPKYSASPDHVTN